MPGNFRANQLNVQLSAYLHNLTTSFINWFRSENSNCLSTDADQMARFCVFLPLSKCWTEVLVVLRNIFVAVNVLLYGMSQVKHIYKETSAL